MKILWKKYRSISAKTRKRFAFTLMFFAVVVANLSPIFAQQGVSSPILSSPSSSSIIHFGTGLESSLISGGECQNGYLGGIVGSGIVEPLSLMVTGTTGYDLGCAKDRLAQGDPSKLLSIVESASGGLVGGFGNAVALLLEQRPLSGIDYIEQQVYALTNPGQVSAQEPPAYYRGTGFDLLRPMQSFWGWSVNIVYSLMILIVIFVAFGIIFKTSLSGGAVVALQAAIPNIVLAMILVPLSYAITGLFVDGITVGVNVVHQFLIGNGSPGYEIYKNRNTEFPLGQLLAVRGSSAPVSSFDRGLYADDIRLSWLYVSANLGYTEKLRPAIINVAGILPLGDAIESVANSFIGDVILVVVNLVIGFILLWTGARIFFLLFKKFVVFLVGPLFAPFIFATIALPSGGTKMIFSYLKSIGSGSLYYIVAYAMFLLSMILASDYILVQVAAIGTPSFMPPLVGLESVVFFADTAGSTIPGGLVTFYLVVASLVIYMLIPSTLKKIDAMLGVNEGGMMAIFNDVKKSVSDSVGMAKAWRDASKKYLYNGLVGGSGRIANKISKTFTGRTLNGPDGWVTNQYKRVAGAARQRIGRMKNSSNIFVKATGYGLGATAGAGMNLLEDTLGGPGSSTKPVGRDGKKAKITAEFGGGDEFFPMQKGNITVTKEGIFRILLYYGFIINDAGELTHDSSIQTPSEPFSLKYKLSFKIEGGSFGSIVTPQAFNFAPARTRHDYNGPLMSVGGYNVAEVFKSGISVIGGPQNASLMDPDRGGRIFDFVDAKGEFIDAPVHFVIDPRSNIRPVYQTSNKQSFQIVFKLEFNFKQNEINKQFFEEFFGKWNKTYGIFAGGTFRKFQSNGYIFKISDIVVNGDISEAESLQVNLIKK